MNYTNALFLDALACAVKDCPVSWAELDSAGFRALSSLATRHSVSPMLIEAMYKNPAFCALGDASAFAIKRAKDQTVSQARRTADFLVLYNTLQDRGLRPAVLKGIVCRSLYPHPEQRPSVDEDLLVDPSEFPPLHQALVDEGLTPVDAVDLDTAFEVAYEDKKRNLYIEVHKQPFTPDSEAVRQMNDAFEGALERTVEIRVYGVSIRTLCPTDHLLYLLCHAYKHLIYSGFGIRQVCDICLFARKYAGEIDWRHVAGVCRRHRIETLAAAVFRIGSEHLDIPAPEIFAGISVDEMPLLEDILTGGLYGVSDENRLHSSNITLGAVEAARKGRRPSGFWRSVFPPREYFENRFPYAKTHPVLLPVAWGQRLYNYLTDRKKGAKVSPAESIRIAAERIQLLREYDIIE